jgi:hypothetical protein
MSGRYKPILIERFTLWWYPAALVPVLALAYLSVVGIVPSAFAPLSLFALFFWIFSLGFAIARKLKRPPPDPPQ